MPKAKFTEEQKSKIHRRWLAGETQTELAAVFSCSQTTISDAIRARQGLGVVVGKRGARAFARRPEEPKVEAARAPFVPPPNPPKLTAPAELWPGEAKAFWENFARDKRGCLRWMRSTDDKGYGQWWTLGRKDKTHRIAWRLTYGAVPDGKQVNHSCDQPDCGEPTHLWLGTQQQNLQDMHAKGRGVIPDAKSGEDNVTAKLTWVKVREIRRLRKQQGWTVIQLAEKFDISKAQVSNIINYRQWVEDVRE